MLLVNFTRALGLLCAMLVIPAAASAQSVRPKSLLVYYGYPSSINLWFDLGQAALEFGQYDNVVWGDGLDDPAHPDHANALTILADPELSGTRVFGYVDLGVSTQNLSMSEVQLRIARWDAMGVDGVLLDDFGYDFGTGRARQNAAVQYAHAQGLAVIANAFRPEDAFGGAIDATYNPAGAPTSLGATDFYLYESHGVRLGEYESGPDWREKSDALEAYRQALGFRVFSITTKADDDPNAYDESRFFYAWHAALLFGHEATGWGEFGYSSFGASNARAPFRARPTLEPGSAFTSPVLQGGSLHFRRTDLGRIELDVTLHTYGFGAGLVAVPDEREWSFRLHASAPNPVRESTRFRFTLERALTARLAVYDASGRRVATIAHGEFSAGPHERSWSALDERGNRVVAGSYFVALETDEGRSVSRFVVVR